MAGAIVTSPFDVVKTRLQSSLFRETHLAVNVVANGMNGGVLTMPQGRSGLLRHFVETTHIIRCVEADESLRHKTRELTVTEGISTEMNPLALCSRVSELRSLGLSLPVDKLLHLRQRKADHRPTVQQRRRELLRPLGRRCIRGHRDRNRYKPNLGCEDQVAVNGGPREGHSINIQKSLVSSLDMIKQIAREEGIRGFYKGLSASYLGVTEGTIQWVLYEKLKRLNTESQGKGGFQEWAGMLGSAGTAKCVASLITYPHEVQSVLYCVCWCLRYFPRQVLRTRLRQPMVNGVKKYTGLVQTLRLVIAEEGARSLYGGLSAHLMRVVPNAAVMFWVYEGILRWGEKFFIVGLLIQLFWVPVLTDISLPPLSKSTFHASAHA
jgi:solute carrier family 25 protein 33/36